MIRGTRLFLRAVAMLLVAGISAPVAALSVSPVHIEMASTGGASRAQVVVRNDSKSPMPVEASLLRFTMDDAGNRKETPASDEFLVFPPQALIPPDGTQVFRLQWVGEPMLARSQSYMLSISQIPVRMPKGSTGVQVALSFGVLINVAPPQGKPDLKLVATGIAVDKQGNRLAAITVHNPSLVHALLPDSSIRMSGPGWEASLSRATLAERVGIGLVQPGQRRRFVLPVQVPASVRSIEASMEYRPSRR